MLQQIVFLSQLIWQQFWGLDRELHFFVKFLYEILLFSDFLLSTPPFYIPSLHTQHCQLTSPPLTLPLYTLTLNFFSTSSLHPLSTSTLYILSIVNCSILSWYCHGLPTGQKTTHPVWLPPFDTSSLPPLYTPFLHPLSTYYPIWLNPLFTLPLPYISSSPNCHSLSTLPLYSSSLPSLHPLFLLTSQKTTPHMTTPLLHSFWASHQSKAILFIAVMEFIENVFN